MLQGVQLKTCNNPHGYLREKTAINSGRGLTDDGKSQEGVKCASVNTGTNVVGMCVVPIKVNYCNSGKVLETCPIR